MKLSTKVASATVAIGLAGTGTLAVLGTGSAAAHVPAATHLTAAPADNGQVSPTTGPTGPAGATGTTPGTTGPAPGSTAVPSGPTLDTPGTELPETGTEATTEPAREAQPAGGGHADAPGTVDHRFEGVE